jgi:hypothetical protein
MATFGQALAGRGGTFTISLPVAAAAFRVTAPPCWEANFLPLLPKDRSRAAAHLLKLSQQEALMGKVSLATIALMPLIAAPALAADMAVKAPPPPAVAYYDWTGFYLGANAGYSIGRDPTTVSALSGITVVDNETQAESFWFTTTTTSEIRDNIIRAGLNYRFGPSNITASAASGGGYYKAPPQAVAAAYNWTGFYAGANAGYSVGRDPSSETELALAGLVPPLTSNDSFKLSPQGGLIGGQLG